jgi:outer membrane lipoprotein LolB
MTLRFWRALGAVAVIALLSSCASAPSRSGAEVAATMALRAQLFAGIERIELRGRVGFSDGRNAGSGEILWQQHQQSDNIELSVPLAQARYRLDSGREGAVLDDGRSQRRAPDADALLAAIFGFPVPLADLKQWSHALATPSPFSAVLNPDGTPLTLKQNGWTIEFRDWRRVDGQMMPHKIFARLDEKSVRLSVSEWQFER